MAASFDLQVEMQETLRRLSQKGFAPCALVVRFLMGVEDIYIYIYVQPTPATHTQKHTKHMALSSNFLNKNPAPRLQTNPRILDIAQNRTLQPSNPGQTPPNQANFQNHKTLSWTSNHPRINSQPLGCDPWTLVNWKFGVSKQFEFEA